MTYIGNNDGAHTFDHFVNSSPPFMSSPQESRSHAYSKGAFPVHEWLSPASTISTSSESMSDYGRYPETPYHPASQPHAGYYGNLAGNDHYLAHQSTGMWRTASAGTALSHSIDSLALESKAAQPGFFSVQEHDADMPFPNHPFIKSEPESDFSPHVLQAPRTLLAAPAMISSVSLPGFGSNSMERRLRMIDIESSPLASSPSTISDMTASSQSAKRGAKRKELGELTNLSLDTTPGSPANAKLLKKGIKAAEPRRPPPSASHFTEAGKPFPTIDTSAKHSSLFVAPDTSGLTKREARLVKNRAAAFLSRQRKREQFEEMEIKCKAISMLVWRMWGAIAGPDASADRLTATPLSAILAKEEPAVQAILEEVISKQGASIAPTGDVDAPDGFGDRSQSPATQQFSTPMPHQPAKGANVNMQKDLENEISRLRTDLASSMDREKALLVELDTARTSSGSQSSAFGSTSLSQPHHTSDDWLAPPAQVPSQIPTRPFLPHSMSMPFRGSKSAEISLYTSDSPFSLNGSGGSPPSSFGFGHNSGLLEPAHVGEGGFDIGKTPTLSMFSDTAMQSRVIKSQPLQHKQSTGAGLGFDYQYDSTSGHAVLPGDAGNPVHLMALMLVVAGLSVMSGLGGAAPKSATHGGSERHDRAAGKPSSHLSEDDLHLDFFHADTPADDAGATLAPSRRQFRSRIALTRAMSTL